MSDFRILPWPETIDIPTLFAFCSWLVLFIERKVSIMVQKRVLGVIGLGHVGAHVAYALAIQGIADELVLVDKNEKKLTAEVQDLRDAAALAAPPFACP